MVTGYVFCLNLAWRLVWAFVGGRRARWSALLPFRKGYVAESKRYLAAMISGRELQYAGHNPLGRLAVTALLVMLLECPITGLVLAGTNIFTRLRRYFATRVAAPGVDAADVIRAVPN